MKIFRKEKTPSEKQIINTDLEKIAGDAYLQPPVCSPACRYCKTHRCRRLCPKASMFLANDPADPIEPGIAPLVFELTRLGVFTPCWSCEGHNSRDHTPWKVPSVWFYAHSTTHLRVLNEVVIDLFNSGHIHVPWKVFLTHSNRDNADTCFSLQPCVHHAAHKLSGLQEDAMIIAEKLQERVALRANQLATNLK